jgi:hypothetical protein
MLRLYFIRNLFPVMTKFNNNSMNLLDSLLRSTRSNQNKVVIVRVCYERLGQILSAEIKVSSGDIEIDNRAIDHVKKQTHHTLITPVRIKRDVLISGMTYVIRSDNKIHLAANI